MAAFYYTALRDLMSGHVVDTDYSFDAALSSLQKQPRVTKRDYVPLGGGAGETVVNRREVTYSVRSIQEDGTDADQWLEFLSSVDGGEQFQVDLTGTVASPGTIQNAKIVGDFGESYSAGSNTKAFSFRFRIID